MHVALITKSATGTRLDLYDAGLKLVESESFEDLYTLNFHLQTLQKKHDIASAFLVVHDKDKNAVGLTLAQDEHSFFVS